MNALVDPKGEHALGVAEALFSGDGENPFFSSLSGNDRELAIDLVSLERLLNPDATLDDLRAVLLEILGSDEEGER